MHLDGCVEVASAYYSAPPGWIGRRVHVQWNAVHVRLLDPRTGQLLREHLRATRGWHRIADPDRPARTPLKTLALLAAAKRAGPATATLCDHIHRHDGAAGVRRILGVLALAKKHGPTVVEQAATAALDLGVPTVTPSLFDERDLAEVTSEEFPGERLIVCRNPLLAAERQRKRHELLPATEKDLAPIAAATRRENKPLRGAAAIGVRVGKVINRYKMAKHFVTEITDERFTFRRNEDKIATEKQLDGIYIVRSNVEPEQFDATQTVRAYKDLSKVERAFRCFKSVDLKVRPLHHRRADRVRAHVLLCMLAYYVEWHMRRALAPLLFDDHDPAAAEQQRTSVVAPARRSPAALAKARRKRTDDDLPVHSFRTLLADLGTLAANTMQVASGGATFTLQTKPTPLQQRCFELLGVTPRM